MGLQARELMSHMELAFRPGSFCLIFVLLNLQSSFSVGHDFPPRRMPKNAHKRNWLQPLQRPVAILRQNGTFFTKLFRRAISHSK